VVGVGRSLVLREDAKKNMAAHKRDEAAYIKHLSPFKKDFQDFIYCSLV
jgi:hypothetical protein